VTIEGWDEDDDCTGDCCRDDPKATETEYEELKTRWLAKYDNNQNAHQVTLLTPLPARTRLRLAVHRRIDRAGAWLCGRHCNRLAEWMWRTCRMW
jgi:hypothetical protein